MQLRLSKKDILNEGSGGLEIKIDGCKGDPSDKAPGCAVFIENYKGTVQVHVWDGTKQDCQTIILH